MILDPSSSSKGACLARVFIVFSLQYVFNIYCRHVNNNEKRDGTKETHILS